VAGILVLQHTAAAGPSCFTEVLDSRTSIAPWHLVHVADEADVPTDLDDLTAVIIMGGTMSATSPAEVPWMEAELDLLRTVVARQIPVLGVCLGAQLLATALGGTVQRRDAPEIGYLPLTRTGDASADPVMGGWQDGAAPLFLHEDEVTTLPPGAVPLLTGSDATAAWRVGDAWAVQFHPEVDAEQLHGWLELDALVPLLEAAGVDGDALGEEASRRDRSIVPIGRALVGRFIDAVVRPRIEA
jgi:GMP synthase (glutamine-hydrolysing)